MSQDETEDTKVDETTAPASEQTNTEDNANDADDTAKDSASESESNEIDYAAELEREQKRLKQAEFTIEQLKKAQKKPEQTEQTEEPSAEVLTRQIEEKYKSELDSFKRELASDIIEGELEKLSTSNDEAALIKFHYENSIKQSGFSRQAIRDDLEAAKLLANRKKLLKENSELKQALIAQKSAGKAAGGSNQDQQVIEDEPKFTPEERQLIQRQADKEGISFKEYVRRNKSKLTNQ